MADLDVSQVVGLSADLSRAGGRVGRKAATVVRRSAQQVSVRAKAAAPSETGALRNSIGVTTTGSGRGSGISATIEADIRYAYFVEFGTSVMAPQPYMAPALDSVEPSFLAAMEQLGGDEMLG